MSPLPWRDADPLPILTDDDPALRRRAAAVVVVDAPALADACRLLATLEAFRAAHGFGRGLAAPQVGINRRMVAVSLGAEPFVVFDPEIRWRSDETFRVWDDCLSVPGRLARVERWRSISLDYTDHRGRRRTWSHLPPDLSELLQHELDHLDGVLMTDRVGAAEDLAPASRWGVLVGESRPQHRLSTARIAAFAGSIDPVFRGTPQYVCEPLSDALGARVTVKVESLGPLRCFKGRGADAFVGAQLSALRRRPPVCASAGNFGQAMAYACRRHGLALTVYAATSANPLKIARMRALGAHVVLEGADFDAAKAAARRHAEATFGWMVEDGLEPEISEGAGSIGVELLAGDEAFDAVLLPLGNGALLNGVGRWIKAASPATEVLGVSAAGAPAMARSWREGRVVELPAVDTLADGVAVRVPIPEAVADMGGIVDDVLLVEDTHTLEAMRLAHLHLGLVLEPAGALGLGAILADPARFAGRSVGVVLCGGNLTAKQARRWLWQVDPD